MFSDYDEIFISGTTGMITYVVITLASLICFLVLVLITKACRWMIGYSAIALAVAYLGLPLIFLFLQNVIPLATGAIALAIIALVLFVIFKVVLAGGSESGSAGSEGYNTGVRKNKIANGKDNAYQRQRERDEQNLEYTKKNLEREKQDAEYYGARADSGYKSARNGDGFFTTAEEKRKQAGKDLDTSNWHSENAERERQRIENLERKLGK